MGNWWQDAITQAWNPPIEWGEDLATPFHTPITALQGGVVTGAGYYGWGGEVDIATQVAGKKVTEYALHLDQIAGNIVPGAQVSPGELLGLSGGQLAGGSHPTLPQYSSGPHTEFGYFVGPRWSGQSLNPRDLIAAGPQGGVGAGPGIPNPVDLIQQLLGGAVSAGVGVSDAGANALGLAAIGQGLSHIGDALNPANVGHGLADAAVAGVTDVGVFAKRQLVALAVAAVVLLVLFY